MNRNDLFESIGEMDHELLERSEADKKRSRYPRWAAAAAALLTLVLVGGWLLRPGPVPQTADPPAVQAPSILPQAHAISLASYPEMAQCPQAGEEALEDFTEKYDAWKQSIQAQKREPGYAHGLEPFWQESIGQFLSGSDGENQAFSPLNFYMALGMLAELTGGETRQQILDLLGTDSIEVLRAQAGDIWNAHYRNDGATTSILASSLWLDEGVPFRQETLDTLARTYYASSYQGEMGSDAMNQMLRDWLSAQTGGLLDGEIGEIELEPDTILALATSIFYQAKWETPFQEEDTAPGTFHSSAGDTECDFLHRNGGIGYYYRGDRFGAVAEPLMNDGGTVLLLLPDPGVSPKTLLADQQAMDFLLHSQPDWEQKRFVTLNLALPKFDITARLDLKAGMEKMGLTEVLDPSRGDFSPMAENLGSACLGEARQDLRVAVDEEGVTAAACTLMAVYRGLPPEETVDFVLDRPFLFAIVSPDGLPLFTGIVNCP